nr:MAG TPA: hypothetical protein [Caudoviricetes sp.]
MVLLYPLPHPLKKWFYIFTKYIIPWRNFLNKQKP